MADYRNPEHAAMERVAQLEREKRELEQRELALRQHNVALEAHIRSLPASPAAQQAARSNRNTLVIVGVVAGFRAIAVVVVAGIAMFAFSAAVPVGR